MLGATASSNAKHLLTRSMEESRVRAAEMPEDREEPGFDYAELAKLVGLRGLPAIAAVILVTIGVYWMSSGWLNDFDLPDLGRVSGVVTKGGQPVAGAEVTFTPLDVDASSATAISDENGEYTLQYLEDVDGAVVGQNRVRISVVDERGRELLAPENVFDRRSNEVWMVESGRQEVPIDITRPFSSPPAATDE
jgi:hypothetical protein